MLECGCHAVFVVGTLLGGVVLAAHQHLDVVEADAQDEEREQVVRPGLLLAQPRRDANHFEVRHENDDDGAQREQQPAVHAVAVAHHDEAVHDQDVSRDDYLLQVTFNHARERGHKYRLREEVYLDVTEAVLTYFVLQQVLEGVEFHSQDWVCWHFEQDFLGAAHCFLEVPDTTGLNEVVLGWRGRREEFVGVDGTVGVLVETGVKLREECVVGCGVEGVAAVGEVVVVEERVGGVEETLALYLQTVVTDCFGLGRGERVDQADQRVDLAEVRGRQHVLLGHVRDLDHERPHARGEFLLDDLLVAYCWFVARCPRERLVREGVTLCDPLRH